MTDSISFFRRSPIVFNETPVETEDRDGFRVVLRYDHEGGGPFLVDLSHRSRWSVMDRQLSRIHPYRMDFPEEPNSCMIRDGFLLLRLTECHGGIWHLSGPTLEMPREFPYIDMTDGYALLALAGPDAPVILEKATPLDLWRPGREPPQLFQGPVFDIPCLLAVLDHSPTRSLVLMACERSHGRSMAENLLKIGEGWKIRPAGERAFMDGLSKRDATTTPPPAHASAPG